MNRKSMVGGMKGAYAEAGKAERKKAGKLAGAGGGEGGKMFESKREGESMRAFNRRIKAETTQVLARTMEGRKGVSERKKGYLKEKKKKGRRKGETGGESDEEEERLYGKKGGDDFGVQAERPPEFSRKQLPKNRKREREELLAKLAEKEGGGEDENENEEFRRRQRERQKREMEELSKKVQGAYKAMKAAKHAQR